MPAKLRKDGRYEITCYIGGKKKHFYGSTAQEAEEKMWRAIIEYKDSLEDSQSSSIVFGEASRMWYRCKSNKSDATKKMYEQDIFPKLICLSNVPINKIDESKIRPIIDGLWDKPNICKKVHMCLNEVFKYAIKKRLIKYNPMDLIECPKYAVNPKSQKGLTKNEIVAIENTEFNHRQTILLKLMLNYGLRKQEACKLQKSNIDLNRGIIIIKTAMDFTNNIPKIKKTKSKAGERCLPILEQDKDWFETIIKDLNDEEYLLKMVTKNAPLTNYSYRNLWKRLKPGLTKLLNL